MFSTIAVFSDQIWTAFAEWYQATTLAITQFHRIGDKFAHLVIGLSIWLGTAHIFRKPLDSRLPLGVVVVLTAGNEAMDLGYSPHWGLNDSALDVVATLFFPFVVALSLRRLGP